jgi:hypothetical protein
MKTRVVFSEVKQEAAQVRVIPKPVDRPECNARTVTVRAHRREEPDAPEE